MTDDFISRQEALKGFAEHSDGWCYINALPPVEPERGKTRWIITQVSCNGTDLFNFRCLCNKCGLELFVDVVNFGDRNACEHCIKDMRFAIENCVQKER